MTATPAHLLDRRSEPDLRVVLEDWLVEQGLSLDAFRFPRGVGLGGFGFGDGGYFGDGGWRQDPKRDCEHVDLEGEWTSRPPARLLAILEDA